MTATTPSLFDDLRSRVRGSVHEPGDEAYADTCTLFNAMIDRSPRAVVRCADAADVIATLAIAREHRLPIAVRGGGHSVAGLCLVEDGLVIDMRDMAGIEVDPVARTVRAGGGATWGQLDRAAGEHGLATTGGRVSSTGVAGLTLGGGSGWLERKHGLACDNLIAVELVTADGRLVRASAGEHPDLFWALRGGGGEFGVVTALEFRLHPVGPEVFAGLVLHPVERGREVLRRFRELMTTAPEGLDLCVLYMIAPDEPEIPEDLRGRPAVAVGGMHAGPVEEGEALLADLRAYGPPAADFFGVTTYADFQCSLDDPPGYRNWWTSEHLAEFSDDVIEVVQARSEQIPLGSASQVLIAAWNGAVSRVAPEDSPMAARHAPWVVHPLALWEDPADDEAAIAWARAYRDDLRPYATGATYRNFTGDEGDARTRAAYGDRNAERLASVKAAWDPDDVFSTRLRAS